MQNFEIISLEETSSTNDYVRSISIRREFTVVETLYQTMGRGQKGNSWHSDKGLNLLFSIKLFPSFLKPSSLFSLSMAFSVAIRNALAQYTPDISIKWPNDIYYKEKKIAGILIENSLSADKIGCTVIGVGLNVNQEEFPCHIPNPCSLKQILKRDISRTEVLETVLRMFEKEYRKLQQGLSPNAEYLEHLYRRNGIYSFADKSGIFKASIKTVEPSGTLVLLDKDNKQRRYAFKEVSYQ